MQNVRRWHRYLGMFTAPSILFFAMTGSLQLFNLHESHGDYQPPALIAKLARVHKDQIFALEHDDDHASVSESAAPAIATKKEDKPAPSDDDDVSTPSLILKWFFLLVALSLVVSTLLGIWMSLSNKRGRGAAWVLLAAGALIPIGLAIL